MLQKLEESIHPVIFREALRLAKLLVKATTTLVETRINMLYLNQKKDFGGT